MRVEREVLCLEFGEWVLKCGLYSPTPLGCGVWRLPSTFMVQVLEVGVWDSPPTHRLDGSRLREKEAPIKETGVDKFRNMNGNGSAGAVRAGPFFFITV